MRAPSRQRRLCDTGELGIGTQQLREGDGPLTQRSCRVLDNAEEWIAYLRVQTRAERQVAVGILVHVPPVRGGAAIEDIQRLKRSGAPVAGVVIGRALYDGRISADVALRAAAE